MSTNRGLDGTTNVYALLALHRLGHADRQEVVRYGPSAIAEAAVRSPAMPEFTMSTSPWSGRPAWSARRCTRRRAHGMLSDVGCSAVLRTRVTARRGRAAPFAAIVLPVANTVDTSLNG